MAAVEPIRVGVEFEGRGLIDKPVARALLSVDQWDVLLILGVVLLVSGVSLVMGALLSWVVGLGSAFVVGGLLLALGGLWGARSESVVAD